MLPLAPCWTDAMWFPMLLELLHDTPLRQPTTPDLLMNAETGRLVGSSETLRGLVATRFGFTLHAANFKSGVPVSSLHR